MIPSSVTPRLNGVLFVIANAERTMVYGVAGSYLTALTVLGETKIWLLKESGVNYSEAEIVEKIEKHDFGLVILKLKCEELESFKLLQ